MLWQGPGVHQKRSNGVKDEGLIATPRCTWLAPFRFRAGHSLAQLYVSPIGCWPKSSNCHDAMTNSVGATTHQFHT